MFVTTDILKAHGADQELVRVFSSLFPEGEEANEIFNNPATLGMVLNFIYEYCALSEEEKAAYENRLGIVNCKNFYRSRAINDCENISLSRNCKGSKVLKKANSVTNSTTVNNSQKIDNSSFIYDSRSVQNSNLVAQSNLVAYSDRVFGSTIINKSKDIFRSDNIFNSHMLRNCSRVEDSYFCANCNNSAFLMFCSGCKGELYQIFNQQVTEEEFLSIREIFLTKFPNLGLNFLEIGKEPFTLKYTAREAYSLHYENLPQEFIKEVKKLPYFNEDVFYNITLIPEWS